VTKHGTFSFSLQESAGAVRRRPMMIAVENPQ
jgi:hypothetical protein